MTEPVREPSSRARRDFIRTTAWAMAGLTLEVNLPAFAAGPPLAAAPIALNPFIRIDQESVVTLVMPQVEMGQGIYTALAMMVAEELDVRLDRVKVEAAPPSDAMYANPLFGFQATGGSTSVRAFWKPMRQTGAKARFLLVRAAAQRWKVVEADCGTVDGSIEHRPTGRRLSYGAVVEAAARLDLPADLPLKPVPDFTLIGKATPRLDTPDKVDGRARFGIDAMPPGFKVATLVTCPVFGGTVRNVDDRKATGLPGVRQVVVLDDLVAVVADHMWAAKQGLAALKIEWNPGPHAQENTVAILQQHRDALARPGVVAKNVGDVSGKLAGGSRLDVQYDMGFLAHAAMEPMNCTVRVDADRCEVWVGNQVISRTQAVAAKLTGLPVDRVLVHSHLIGGGFGRRLEVDGVEKAVRIARKVPGVPVKVVWTREEDIGKAMYKPMWADRVQATVVDGRIDAWHHRLAGSSVLARWYPPGFKDGLDSDVADGAIDFPYDTPNLRVEYSRVEPASIPTCFWRGVGPGHNLFVVESAVDELAHQAKQDPVAFRRVHLAKNVRLRAVLDLAATKSGWGDQLPARSGRGISLQTTWNTFMATVTEVVVDPHGDLRVKRITCVVDCGVVINPDTVVAQIQGGLIFGLTAALYGEVTVENGRVKQSNFHDYRMLRIDEAPAIDVHLVTSGEAPGGIGEPGTAAAAPSLYNALFAATGVRLRHLPIDRKALAVDRAASR